MKKRKYIKRALKSALAAYLAFIFLAGLLPYAFPPGVDEAAVGTLQATRYTAEEQGPDRALLVESTTDAFGVRVQMLREATQSLDIVYHTVQPGESTDAFFGEVVNAADRGVAVRIIVDAKAGALGSDARGLLKALAAHDGIEVRQYNPLGLFTPWRWNSILHDKFILADGALLLLGGRNLGDRYYEPEGYPDPVVDDRDVLVWNTGAALGNGVGANPGAAAAEGADADTPGAAQSVLGQAGEYMALLWEADSMRPLAAGEGRAARLEELRAAAVRFEEKNPRYYSTDLAGYLAASLPTNKITLVYNPINTNAKQPHVGYALRQLMLGAGESVVLQTPYATSNKHFLAALEDTAAAVPVTMLTNSLASSPNYPAFSNYWGNRGRFAATGAEIYEYQSWDSIHGKSLLVDGRISAVGSFNMDDRSLVIDTETMLVIDSVPFAAALEGAMEGYMAQSLVADGHRGYVDNPQVELLEAPLGKRIGMLLFRAISSPFRFLV